MFLYKATPERFISHGWTNSDSCGVLLLQLNELNIDFYLRLTRNHRKKITIDLLDYLDLLLSLP